GPNTYFEGYENNFDNVIFAERFSEGEIGFVTQESYKKFKVNHVSLNKDLFLKFWPQDKKQHSLYNIEDLSFPFFISNRTDILANKSVRKNNFIWYPTDKELNLQHQF
ncbi:hypothetical protein, partial [[Flexibacter] sp. ATCC 35208]|uniref:hypothetical protein n=1 Tax=[Flexibacter] sp. ATCC 35208 TaxID=1936242 RepID=UPI0009CB70A2